MHKTIIASVSSIFTEAQPNCIPRESGWCGAKLAPRHLGLTKCLRRHLGLTRCLGRPQTLHRPEGAGGGATPQPCLEKVMEVLADSNTHLVGVYGSSDESKDTLIEKVRRRVLRDKLFKTVLTVTVTPDVKKIQEEIACQLGLTFNNKSKDRRAQELIERMKIEQKILIILSDLHKGLDLGKVGIPYGSDHTGCKILLTSTTEDLLSKHMHTQKNFNVGY